MTCDFWWCGGGIGIRADVVIGPYIVEAKATPLHFLQAENFACVFASPLPEKAIRFSGGTYGVGGIKNYKLQIKNYECGVLGSERWVFQESVSF